jgi:tryptophanyl-tRNA synthetase
MVVDWLAAGINPNQATIFVQSQVMEHAELSLLLGMITPVGWLERVPTYKDQQQKLADKDLSTFGFLGYPLMQGADILIYRANLVPVGEDQVSHLELARELARRFNHIYGREPGFEDKAKAAVKKLGSRKARRYQELRTAFQEKGDQQALEAARQLLNDTQNLSLGDRERLFGYLEGSRRVILPEPQPLLTETPKVPGLDGQKMSKSYGNAIWMREDPAEVTKKIRTMQTDPARVRRTDKGNPEVCPVWDLHKIYSNQATRDWVWQGCTTAGIGCLDCKQPVIDAIIAEQAPMRERAQRYLDDPTLVRNIVADGCERARRLAEETMRDVRAAMGLDYT